MTITKRDRLVKIIDAKGNKTRLVYDAKGRVVTVIDPLRRKQKRTYDAVDNIVTTTNPLGYTVQTRYDKRNNPIQVSSYNMMDCSAHNLGNCAINMFGAAIYDTPSYAYEEYVSPVVETVSNHSGGEVRGGAILFGGSRTMVGPSGKRYIDTFWGAGAVVGVEGSADIVHLTTK